MRVQIAALTTVMYSAFPEMARDTAATQADSLAEAAGRQCYESFHKPNSKTRSNKDYLANILNQQHESVLEHASVSFRVTGVSRNLLLELERHRHLSFSVISQRYVDSSTAEFVTPPALRGSALTPEDIGTLMEDVAECVTTTRDVYRRAVDTLTSRGLSRKAAREAARSVLPGGTETKFIVTGNIRAWRDVLKKRWSDHAEAEICLFAGEVLGHLRVIAPNSFQDFPEVPFS